MIDRIPIRIYLRNILPGVVSISNLQECGYVLVKHDIIIQTSHDIRVWIKLEQWCKENLPNDHYTIAFDFWFTTINHAMYFKLSCF